MLPASARLIEERLADDAVVLDVGAWGRPFRRADWVLDRMPYETRGLYGFDGDGPERFSAETWIERDVCGREPFPFEDGSIDFAVCSHTLEDLRDPIWVCHELMRVAKAGYIETPSRLEEQSLGVQGPWAGWGHHFWLVDTGPARITFTFKHHVLHQRPADHFPVGFADSLRPEERVAMLWWEGAFEVDEQVFSAPGPLDAYLAGFVSQELAQRDWSPPPAAGEDGRRLAARLRRRVTR